MVNFTCQIHWAMKCLKIWLTIILSVSVFFWMRLTWICRLSRLPFLMWVGLSSVLKAWLELKGTGRENSFSLPVYLWAGTLVFYCLWTWTQTKTRTWTQTGAYTISQFSGFWAPTGTTPWALLGLQTADCWEGPPYPYEPIPYNKSLYRYNTVCNI